MTLFDLIFLAIALAMDCFAVSIACGVILRQALQKSKTAEDQPLATRAARKAQSAATVKTVVRMALLFGLFQAMMPLIGWLATTHFQRYIEAYDHWIAFSMLLFLGLRMVRSAFLPEEAPHTNPTRLTTQVTLAIATSIDALAVGISFACTGYSALAQLTLPLLLIGLASFLLTIVGHALGLRFGSAIARRLRPELLGGLILIFIGVKVLLSHLL